MRALRVMIVSATVSILALAGPASAGGTWSVVSSPNPGGTDPYSFRYLQQVTAGSPVGTWAAGAFSSEATGEKPLIAFRSGSSWIRDGSVPVPAGGAGLDSIDTDGTSLWAAGNQGATPFVVHYDNPGWSENTTTGAPANMIVRDVAVVSDTDVWVVGWISGTDVAAAIHWNGSTWTSETPALPLGASGSLLDAVQVIPGTTDVMATGYFYDGQTRGYAIRWNGSSWAQQSTPSTPYGELRGLVVLSATNAWAVGTRYPTNTPPDYKALIEHWNGTSWSVVSAPAHRGDDTLLSIDANGRRDIVAVGYGQRASIRTFALRYDGANWAIQSTPDPSTTGIDELWGTSYVPGTNTFWAVGEEGPGRPGNLAKNTLIERCTC
jgi:hypothetical protein